MPRRVRRMGADATALQKSSEAMSNVAATMLPDSSTFNVSGKTAVTVSPTESEISTVAYQLWLNNGRPVGSDREDWLRGEATLKNAAVAQWDDRAERVSIPCD